MMEIPSVLSGGLSQRLLSCLGGLGQRATQCESSSELHPFSLWCADLPRPSSSSGFQHRSSALGGSYSRSPASATTSRTVPNEVRVCCAVSLNARPCLASSMILAFLSSLTLSSRASLPTCSPTCSTACSPACLLPCLPCSAACSPTGVPCSMPSSLGGVPLPGVGGSLFGVLGVFGEATPP
jgi:hypothetical protein